MKIIQVKYNYRITFCVLNGNNGHMVIKYKPI